MGYKAVVFDLFGTLVDQFPGHNYGRLLSDLARALDIPVSEFTRVWTEAAGKRVVGVCATVGASLEYVYEALGLTVDAARVAEAAHIRMAWVRGTLVPRHDAVETLSTLKGAGFKLGLVSNCTPEVPVLWQELPMALLVDVAVFSCISGLKKPDARIYLLACERLGVSPQECLYVGDGGDQELTGAARVGMHPVLIPGSYAEDSGSAEVAQSKAGDKAWQGARIRVLRDVLDVIGDGPPAV